MEPVVVGGSGELAAPERNKFFYGKLMDVAQFEKEQQYFLRQQWLMNRLTIGSGVLCGLAVVPRGTWHAIIQPGVAIDALGRPIVVSRRFTVDLRQRTDDKGDPIGDPVSEGE